jgi:hypothetical protein
MKPHGSFVCGEVVALTDSVATLQDGRQLHFEYCAIATGSNYAVGKASDAGSVTAEARRAEVQVCLWVWVWVCGSRGVATHVHGLAHSASDSGAG